MDQRQPPPPQWSTRFLSWFLKKEYLEDILGDLQEEHQLRGMNTNWLKAKRWYNWQILKLFRPSMMKKFKTQNTIEKETSMLRNYLKIGLRNLWKYKTGTFINVIGLSSGLAAFVLIALFIQDEYRYDRHFENAADIYRVTVKNYERSGNISRHWAFASAGHAERLKTDYANILHATRIMPGATPDLIVQDKRFPEEEVVFASQDIFKIFNFPFIEGNAENAFEGLYSLVLTRSSAAKLFGDDWQEKRVIGHQVVMAQDNNSIPFTIKGIMEDMPEQQHFHFSYLAPIRFLEQILDEGTMNNVGGNYNWLTYIQTAPGTSMPQLQEHINEEFWDKYMGKLSTGEEARMFYDFEFQPILDIHLTSNLESEIETNGSIQQVYIFSIIGILLLLVACVNYMNIATSHYSRRMKEVGIRKVIGAFKSSLVKQFLTESTLITVISFPLSLLLIQWVLPYLNRFMGKTLIFNPAAQSDLLGLLLVLLIFVSILAGLYPALFLSRINLVKALKGEKVINTSRWNFRSWLVTFQYAVTISLIFAILVIEGQMQYIKKSDPGYEREYVLRVDIPRNSMSDTYKNELLSHPNVMKASYSSRIPTGRLADNWRTRFIKGDSAETINFRLPMISVDPDFLDTYAIDLIAGENFRENKMTVLDGNTTVPGQYIINESAAKALGFIDASEIIGEELIYGSTKGPIIGVMEDFHFESLHSQIVPMLLMFHDDFRHISLKIGTKDIPATLAHIEDTYAMFDAETTVRYHFVDELFDEQYQKEERLSTMIKVFALIAILIGCLGLIGMVGFIIETKVKEIGVRKVLGASSQNIWMLIGNQFLVLAGIAFLLALPISYWLLNGWLNEFVYRIDISVLTIIAPVIVTILLTFLVTSYQTLRATRVNPVAYLKDE